MYNRPINFQKVMGMDTGRKPLSIKDIAAISGVSITTVSRILNQKGTYSPETKKKVLAVASSYGYVPNLTARSLREAKSNTIGLIVPNVTNPFFSQLALYIETYLFEKGYSLLICNSANDPQRELTHFHTLTGKGVDGVLCLTSLNGLPDDILDRGLPIVCIDRRPFTSRPIPWVGNDGALTIQLSTEHLLDKGCRHILFISSYLGQYHRFDRQDGYRKALESRGLFVDQNYILKRPGLDPTSIEVEVLIYQFLQSGLPLDGIVTISEAAAFGALFALKQAGLSVPEDVRLVGYDNTLYSLMTTPPLSSIERNPQKIAHASCGLLLDLIGGKDVWEETVTIPAQLVERESSL